MFNIPGNWSYEIYFWSTLQVTNINVYGNRFCVVKKLGGPTLSVTATSSSLWRVI
jgi:hypothetical protein